MKNVLVVFGGGGMKGLAHIGVLKVLDALGVNVVAYGGTSIGALVAALAAARMPIDEMEQCGVRLKRRDILDFNLAGLFLRRFRARAMYRGDRYYNWIDRTLPVKSFAELDLPCFVNAVNLRTGANVIFGLPGLDHVPLRDAVYASCTMPGVFRSRRIEGELYVDGAVVDNLQMRLAKFLDVDLVIGVNLHSYESLSTREIERKGFLSLMTHAHQLTTSFVLDANLAMPAGVPRLLISPDVARHAVFGFDNVRALVDEGERAAWEMFERAPNLFHRSWLPFGLGAGKRNPLYIDADRCTGCGACVVNDPHGVFRGRLGGKVTVDRTVRHPYPLSALKLCPFHAIGIDPDALGEVDTATPSAAMATVPAADSGVLASTGNDGSNNGSQGSASGNGAAIPALTEDNAEANSPAEDESSRRTRPTSSQRLAVFATDGADGPPRARRPSHRLLAAIASRPTAMCPPSALGEPIGSGAAKGALEDQIEVGGSADVQLPFTEAEVGCEREIATRTVPAPPAPSSAAASGRRHATTDDGITEQDRNRSSVWWGRLGASVRNLFS